MSGYNRAWIANGDNEHALSGALKLAEHAKPGSVVVLSQDEYQAFKDGEIEPLPGEWLGAVKENDQETG